MDAATDALAQSPGDEILLVAGEASGDLHGAHLMEELRSLEPSLRFVGLGGDRMRRAGLDAVAHSDEIAVVGLVEVLRILPRARQIFSGLLEVARRRRPRLAVLIDAPDFNLRLARRLHEIGIPVVYYVSPQIWAWRSGRVERMRGVIDRMLVLFPFEKDFYDRAGVDCVHVGHPLLDVVPEVAGPPPAPADGSWSIGLLPGSRNSEVRRILPAMLGAAGRVEAAAGTRSRLLRAPGVSRELIGELVAASGLEVEVVDAGMDAERFDWIRSCRLALCASGTATLEVGLLQVPMVVCYRMAAVTHALARRLVRVDHISLVNLVLGRRLVPELVQSDAQPEPIATAALSLLMDGPPRSSMVRGLAELRPALGSRGASRRAAQAVLEVAGRSAPSGREHDREPER